MSILKAIKSLVTGSAIMSLVRNEVHEGLLRAADKVVAKYGATGKELVQAADRALAVDGSPLGNPEKLFFVATKLLDIIASKGGPKVAFGIAVVAAQSIYEQTKLDAETEINAALAVL